MTRQQVHRLMDIYSDALVDYAREFGYPETSHQGPTDLPLNLWPHLTYIGHLFWAIDQVRNMEIKSLQDVEKQQRWIGWLQHSFADDGFFTIDDTREHVRKTSPVVSDAGQLLLEQIRSTEGAEIHRDDWPSVQELVDQGFVRLGPARGPGGNWKRAYIVE